MSIKRNDNAALAPAAILAIVAIGALVLFGGVSYGINIGVKNDIIEKSEKADTQFQQVGVAYQRAFRLIPQLLDRIESDLAHEARVMENITALRSGLSRAENGTVQDQDTTVQQAMLYVKATVEAYPELQSLKNSQIYSIELINTENKIASEKVRYNDYAKEYNAYIKSFGWFPWTSPNAVVKNLGDDYTKPKVLIGNDDMPARYTSGGQTY